MGNVPPKKVINADAGDADHVGGNDWDDVVDFLNDQDKTGPVKINTETWFRDGKLKFRDAGNDHLYTHNFANLAANRAVGWPLLTADDEVAFKAHTSTLTNKTIDSKDNTIALHQENSRIFKVGSTYYAVKHDGTLIDSDTVFENVFSAAIALAGTIVLSNNELSSGFTNYDITSGTTFTIPNGTQIIGESTNVAINVPQGFASTLFDISSNAGRVQFKNFIVTEQGTPARNWTAFKWSMNSGESASLLTAMDHVIIVNSSVGIELETLHSSAYLNDIVFRDIIIYGTRTGVLFDQQAGDIDENEFDNVNVQSTTGVTTTGFKDINGTGNMFLHCNVWDPDDSATEANIKSTADGTQIIGGRMTGGKGHFIDQGSKTLIIDTGNITTTRLFATPDLAKIGFYSGATSLTNSTGILTGRTQIVTVGTGANSATCDSSGVYRTLSTGGTTNSISGQYSDGSLTTRINNPYFKSAIQLNNNTNMRVFAGFVNSTSAPASSSDPLNTLEGIGLWLDTAVSANWKRYHNDNSGAGTVDDTTVAAATGTLYPVEIYAVGDSKFRFVFEGVSTDISSNIPASTTTLGFRVYLENTTGSDRVMRYYYTTIKTDR